MKRILIWSMVVLLALPVAGALALCCVTVMPGDNRVRVDEDSSEQRRSLENRLEEHVRVLAEEIGPRYLGGDGRLERARDYIEGQLGAMGYEPRREDVHTEAGVAHNIEVEIPGKGPTAETVVFGAHYDTDEGTPGADDNASGVAALLEVARAMRGSAPSRTVRLVAFANEEPPYFQTDRMGSVVYAEGCKARGDTVVAMLALEMLGYYSDEPDSQAYPALIGWRFPDRGDFVAVVSDLGALPFVKAVVSRLRAGGRMPIEGAALPSMLPGVWWSDHYGFRKAGYDAAMITDTALFRNPHYHRSSDTPETLDYNRLARITEALTELAIALARDDQFV